MAENLNEIENMVKLAKELNTKISVAMTHEYCNTLVASPTKKEISKIARKLIEMKKKGYPLVNSISYFKVMAKDKSWICKPWAMINIGPDGKLVLPCYVRNEYATGASVLETSIKQAISGTNWKEIKDCQKCNLHCYVEPSLVLSRDFRTYMYWAFGFNI